MILSALLLQHDEVSRCWPCQPLDVSGAVSCSHQLLVVSPWWELVNLPNYIKFFMKYVSLCFLRSAVMRAYVDYDYACLLLTAHPTRQTQHSPAGGEQLCCIRWYLHHMLSSSLESSPLHVYIYSALWRWFYVTRMAIGLQTDVHASGAKGK